MSDRQIKKAAARELNSTINDKQAEIAAQRARAIRQKKRRRRAEVPLSELSNRLVFDAAYKYVHERLGAKKVDAFLADKYPIAYEMANLSNEKVVAILALAIERGFLELKYGEEHAIADLLRQQFAPVFTSGKVVEVVNIAGRGMRTMPGDTAASEKRAPRSKAKRTHTAPIVEQMAQAAADKVLELVYQRGGESWRRRRVRIGLGAGYTAMCVVRRLGKLLRTRRDCPPLALHALTPGFSLNPLESPVTYFRFFEGTQADIEYVGLSAPPFATRQGFEQLRAEPEFKAAIEMAHDLDIVITSLAAAADDDGMLRGYLSQHYVNTYRELEEQKWVGDVQFFPYNQTQPLHIEDGVRAVSLLDLHDLQRMIREKGAEVVLLAGPCNVCGRLKTSALKPLLTSPELDVWTRLIVDVETGAELTGRELDDRGLATADELPRELTVQVQRRPVKPAGVKKRPR